MGASTKTRGQRAYELRSAGKSWPEIARIIGGYEGAHPDSAVTNIAKQYAARNGLTWPVRVPSDRSGKEPYDLRCTGVGWREVGKALGLDAAVVFYRARTYARGNDKPWPIKVEARQGARERHRRAYELRAKGFSWAEVGTRLSMKNYIRAVEAARRHARREGLAWPVVVVGDSVA